jgi:hypothetical protein
MTTTWINKDIFKEGNFSIKEGFADISLNINPLEKFLQANPLKSIFDFNETFDNLNDSQDFNETFDNLNDSQDFNETFDNLNEIGKEIQDFNTESTTKITIKQLKQDDNIINSILISLFTLFISLYVSYNWYFNMTEGYKKRFKFYEKFEFTNYLYFFTEYFYNIIQFFDKTITEYIPNNFVKNMKDTFFKERSLFVLIFLISYFSVNFFIRVILRLYNYLNTYIETGKIDLFKLMYDPKKNNILATILFVGFVIYGFFESLASIGKKMLGNKMDAAINIEENLENKLNPGERFKDALMQFKIANPISYMIIFLIRVSLLYGPTVSSLSALFLIFFMFYSFLGIPYYMSQDNTDNTKNELFYDDNMSFIEMFRRIHAYMNTNNIFCEILEQDPNNPLTWKETLFNWAEIFFRTIFNFSPYIIMFSGLFSLIPSILKVQSQETKWTGITVISILSIIIFNFMRDEIPILYVKIQEFKNAVDKVVETVSNVFHTVAT